jgi:D-alanyl-D-alanine carboxypeptidase (penicillin-binding protein 5/6)
LSLNTSANGDWIADLALFELTSIVLEDCIFSMKSLPRLPLMLGALCAAALSLTPPANAQQTTAAAYVVVDHQTGHVLDSLNSSKKLPISSLTKIATAAVVLDWAQASNQNLDQLATVPALSSELQNSRGLGLAPGDKISLRELLYACLLPSDNAAAETLADHVGRSLGGESSQPPIVSFVSQMNALARKLGMRNTRFLNAHGLEGLEWRRPYSTAQDVAKLTVYAMSNPAFRYYVSQETRRIVIRRRDGQSSEYRLRNTNELLGKEAIDGVKTGTSKNSGQCLVISAARPPEAYKEGDTFYTIPRRLEVVVLGSQDRFTEASGLLKRGWKLFDRWVAEGRPLEPVKTAPARSTQTVLPPSASSAPVAELVQ